MVKKVVVIALFLLFAAALTACQPAQTPAPATPCPTAAPCPECPACPTPEEPLVKEVPYEELWAASGHNKADALAFNFWNEQSPPEIPTFCANCHSTAGYLEYIATGAVSKPIAAPAGTIQCVACHNETAAKMTSVKFPQTYLPEGASEPVNVEVSGLGGEARCMVCHQGRASKSVVDDQLKKFGEALDPDAVVAPIKDEQGNEVRLGFINIHYYPAGATLYGTQVKGGYEYEGKSYDGKFRHVEGFETCIGCHDSHSLEVKVEACAECHEGVASAEDLRKVRMQGSLADYDGDGDVSESIDSELKGIQEKVFAALQEYAKSVAGQAILYESARYPYFFGDDNENGQVDEGEKPYANWTPRLLKAAYNYQMSVKDPGAFAHNAKYMIQLLYDSLEDLNAKLGTVDMSAMHRQDPGHFAGNTFAFRYWDSAGKVAAACVKCHTAEGVPQFLENGANIKMPPSNGFACTTCHNPAEWPALYVVSEVTFPSGAKLTFGGRDAEGKPQADESNLCLLCHQGRSSTVTVNNVLAGKDPETPDPSIFFQNIHYFAAGATIFGAEAQGAYQFEGKDYVGFTKHPVAKCQDCHDVHALEVKVQSCTGCHAAASNPQDPKTYRLDPTDYDGDGDTAEGIAAEMEVFAERLYAAILAYAKGKGTPIVYDPVAYPYFFVDADEDGKADVGEKGRIAYNAWTPTLLKAAYNYQYYQKDPGAFTHNPKYVLQVLYDAIQALGGDLSGLTRPATP